MKIAMIRKAGAIKRILRRCRLRRLLAWVWAVVTICSGCTRFVSTCIFQLLSQGRIADIQTASRAGASPAPTIHDRDAQSSMVATASRAGANPAPTIHDRDAQSSMVGATLAVALLAVAPWKYRDPPSPAVNNTFVSSIEERRKILPNSKK